MLSPLIVAKSDVELGLLPGMANRHGLIAGATGTGNAVTLQRIAEELSAIGVPVFMADVKGDLAGLAMPGDANAEVEERSAVIARSLVAGHYENAVDRESAYEKLNARAAARAMGSEGGRRIIRGVLGSILGGRR